MFGPPLRIPRNDPKGMRTETGFYGHVLDPVEAHP